MRSSFGYPNGATCGYEDQIFPLDIAYANIIFHKIQIWVADIASHSWPSCTGDVWIRSKGACADVDYISHLSCTRPVDNYQVRRAGNANLTGCETALLRATAFRQARSWEGQLVIDTVIFGLTAYRAYTDHNVMKLVDGSLIKRMMKDVRRCVFPVLYLKDQLATENYNSNYRLSPQLSVALIARLGLNLKRAGAPPPTCTEDPDSTKLDVIRFKDPRPPQPLEEATFDDEDFELVAERENARIREYLPDSAAELVNQTNREGDRAQIHALDFWWDMALAAPRFASSMA
ncbi:hypothetical protein C8J57DRAFT_1225653 [Mycena rebaudengoi]|nr:hypothetical protein C8J57DRAFT_1225653 [Mycena rebaudengoi]